MAAPAPPGQIAMHFGTVFSDRAQAMSQMRAAIDGLLGMHPLAVAGALTNNGTVVSTPTLLSSTEATNRIAAAGALLARSDRNYAAMRGELARSTGHVRVPARHGSPTASSGRSVPWPRRWTRWRPRRPWRPRINSSSRSVRLTPPALPSPTGVATPGVSTLTPTTSVTVSVVLSNLGTADEPRATVHITLAAQVGGRTAQ